MTRFSMTRRGRALLIAATLGAVSSLPARAADMQVNIDNFAFTPMELTVKAGTTIVFRNQDDIPHIVAGANGEFHSKALDTGDGFSFTFAKAGSYGYFCVLHPRMQGKIVVTPRPHRSRRSSCGNHAGMFISAWFRDSEGAQEVQKVLLVVVGKLVVLVDDGICFGCNRAVIRPTQGR